MILLFFIFFSSLSFCSTESEEIPSPSSIQWSMEKFNLSLTKDSTSLPSQEGGIRREAIEAILQTYQSLNENGTFRTEESRAVPPRYGWEVCDLIVKSAHGKLERIDVLLPLLGCPLERSFEALRLPGYMLDCTMAYIVAQARLCSVFSPKDSPNYCTNMTFLENFSKRYESTPDNPLVRLGAITPGFFFSPTETGLNGIEPADHVYIAGHPRYVNVNPKGGGRGENVFFVGYDQDGFKRYIGFGPLFRDGPRKGQDIQRDLANQYTTVDSRESFETSYQNVRGSKDSLHSSFLPKTAQDVRGLES